MARSAATRPAPEQSHRMTYEEFLANVDEDAHAEWVDGEVCIFVPPSTRHQDVLVFLATLLRLFVGGARLGKVLVAPCEMRLANSAREPDVLYVGADHADRIMAQRVMGPADLVVEIVSDESATRDRHDKFYEYAAAGIPEYWLVDPREGSEGMKLYVLNNEGCYEETRANRLRRLESTVLPGFWLDHSWLTREDLPNELAVLAEMAPDLLRRR